MKKIILLLICITYSSFLFSQEVPIPDFAKRPFFVDNKNELENFERLIAVVDYKVKGLGYGGGELYFTVTPSRSLMRFPLSDLPRFIIKTEPNQDPSETIYLSKAFEVNSKRRRFLTSKISLTGKSKEVQNQYIQIEFEKIAEDVYEIKIVELIGNGEYAFIPFNTAESARNMGSNVFINCFGID